MVTVVAVPIVVKTFEIIVRVTLVAAVLVTVVAVPGTVVVSSGSS